MSLATVINKSKYFLSRSSSASAAVAFAVATAGSGNPPDLPGALISAVVKQIKRTSL